MILSENILPIGRLLKPHGIKGEITLLFDKEAYADVESPYYIIEVEGIFVPFFVETLRYVSDVSAKVKFEDLDDEVSVARYSNSTVFLPKESMSEEMHAESEWDYFLGFSVADKTLGDIGKIEEIDTSTLNVLFVVRNNEAEYLIPATEDFILEIDENRRVIRMDLPEGLINEEHALTED